MLFVKRATCHSCSCHTRRHLVCHSCQSFTALVVAASGPTDAQSGRLGHAHLLSCSRAMAGLLPQEKLTDVLDDGGSNFLQCGKAAGYCQSQDAQAVLQSARSSVKDTDFFLELHIEQGEAVQQSAHVASHVQL
jgi:hypothetical protein